MNVPHDREILVLAALCTRAALRETHNLFYRAAAARERMWRSLEAS